MTFTLPDAHDAQASLGMSKETMEYRHGLHHNAGAVARNGIFDNVAQHWTHARLREMMGPGGTREGHRGRKRRQPAVLRPDRASGLRRPGAQLLRQLPQQASGLSHQLPGQAGELEKRGFAAVVPTCN